jgi:hypothetical protein
MQAAENDSTQKKEWCKLVRGVIEKGVKQTAAKQRLSATFVVIVAWVTINRKG